MADMRSLATGIESFRVDNKKYPEGTDNPARMSEDLVQFLGAAGAGLLRHANPWDSGRDGRDRFQYADDPDRVHHVPPSDPFAGEGNGVIPYAYRNAKTTLDGYILTSVGPDVDLRAPNGRGSDLVSNPLSTAADGNSPARLGDINERAVIHFIEGTGSYTRAQRESMRSLLSELTYDPTNGTISEGDLFRLRGTIR